MDSLTGICALAVLAVLLALSVRRYHAELALCITLAAGTLLISAAFSYLDTILSFLRDLIRTSGLPSDITASLLRTVGITVTVHLSAELCRDAGENALAAKLELIGSAACIVTLVPTLASLLQTIGELL